MALRTIRVDPVENLICPPARLAVADLDGARQLFVVAPPSKGLHRHAEKRGEFTSANQCTFSERYVDAINGGGSIYIIEGDEPVPIEPCKRCGKVGPPMQVIQIVESFDQPEKVYP